MADEVKPEDAEKAEGKKQGLASKIPLDAVLLVAVPFVVFVILFMHVMGFLPPQPLRIKVITPPAQAEQTHGNLSQAPVEETQQRQATERQSQVEAPALEDTTAGQPAETAEPEAGNSKAETTQPQPEVAKSQESKAKEQVAGSETEEVEEKASEEIDRTNKFKQLAKVYEQMKASSVAAIVTKMSDEEAIQVLVNMKPRNAAKVLAALEPERAAKLSRLLTD